MGAFDSACTCSRRAAGGAGVPRQDRADPYRQNLAVPDNALKK